MNLPSPYLPILVVEDDADLREAIVDTLNIAGFQAIQAGNGEEALQKVQTEHVGLILSDAHMQPMDGYTLFSHIKCRYPGIPFVIMTAYGVIEKAIELLRSGAVHYLLKPFEPTELIQEIKRHTLLVPNVEAENVVAQSNAMRQLFALAHKAAPTDVTIMISGPSGVGKEVMARYIHEHSSRSQGPFVAVNCAAIPENLLESILFGHEKGAFTGAHQTLAGKFEQANGGTILLDEISEMPLALQAKLLRVLQEREVERVGGSRLLKLDIRFLATSNKDLHDVVKMGIFREDLYFRLNVFPLAIPPLVERKDDILPLAHQLLKKHKVAFGRPEIVLSQAAEACLTGYSWEGNIRELDNVIQRAVILANGIAILPSDLMLTNIFPTRLTDRKERVDFKAEAPQETSSDIRLLERQHILETLKSVHGVRKIAAKKLGMSERTLRYKLQRYREEGVID